MNAPIEHHLAATALRALPVSEIQTSRTHVQALRRARFTEEGLADLAASVKETGVVQPIIVRPVDEQHEIVAGERRWRAAVMAGFDTIPAIVRDLTDEQVLEVQIIENLQREELLPLEEAEGYRELMNLKGIAAEDVGDLVGKSRSWVYGRLKLARSRWDDLQVAQPR